MKPDILVRTGEHPIAEPTIGSKLGNRCKNAFDNSQLVIVGGAFDGLKAKSPLFMPSFKDSSLPPMDIYQRAGFNLALPKTYEAMLLVGGSVLADSYIEEIGGNDAKQLPGIGVDLISQGNGTGIVLRQVFGATPEMPLRALSSLPPPLIYMENMRKQGIEQPQLQMVFANHISATLNHMDMDQVQEQSRKFVNIAQGYVDEFFPDLVDAVVFLEDTPLEKDSVLRRRLIEVVRVLDGTLSDATKSELMAKAMNRSNRVNPYYGAAHLLLHDASLPESLVPVLDDQAAAVDPKTIISIGGHQEKLFYRIRHELKPHLGEDFNTVNTLQYFTKHRVPPYYMAQGGDVPLSAVLNGDDLYGIDVSATAAYDLRYLHKVSQDRGDFGEFLAGQAERMAA